MSKLTLICGTPAGALYALQPELADGLVVGGHGTLALHDVYLHLRLEGAGRREYLLVVHGERGVALDDARGHTAHGLDGERHGHDVKEQQLAAAGHERSPAAAGACQRGRLDGSALGHALVGVDAAFGMLAR